MIQSTGKSAELRWDELPLWMNTDVLRAEVFGWFACNVRSLTGITYFGLAQQCFSLLRKTAPTVRFSRFDRITSRKALS